MSKKQYIKKEGLKLDRGLIRASHRDGLSIPYRMTKEQCWTFTPCPNTHKRPALNLFILVSAPFPLGLIGFSKVLESIGACLGLLGFGGFGTKGLGPGLGNIILLQSLI